MRAPQVEKWIGKLPPLNPPQRSRLQAALQPAAGLKQAIALITHIRAPARRCPRCGCASCYRHGFANDLQR